MSNPMVLLLILAFGFQVGLAQPVAWSLDLEAKGADKLVWESEPGTTYNLWFSDHLAEPFLHVEGYPKEGNGEPMEHLFNAGTRGFFRIDTAPTGFAFIPQGSFEMGDSFNEGNSGERPVHTVFVSSFYMETKEVTVRKWNEVRDWGRENGYHDLPREFGKDEDHAVHSIFWQDAMKWCNARSEMEGLTPCYYADFDLTLVHRDDWLTVYHEKVDWEANGYRLPTEAQWEKAARGGLQGKRFPNGDTIGHQWANYYSDRRFFYDGSLTFGWHPDSTQRDVPYTVPSGSLLPNNYGLYDMSGGMWEWCWDAFDDDYYGESDVVDPKGPYKVWKSKVARGGSWTKYAFEGRCAYRRRAWYNSSGVPIGLNDDSNWDNQNDYGFRVVRRP
ncbi:MAG: formylglycine-generating enzyme family protein [Akkermansiaceae bacterium]